MASHRPVATLEELCAVAAELCGRGVEGVTVEPQALRECARQLQALSDALEAKRAAKPAAKQRRARQERRWADLPSGRGGSTCGSLAGALLVLGLTLPYYVCVRYNAWFIDEGFAITRNPDAQGQTPVLEVLRHDFWGTHLNPPEGYTTHKSFRPLVTLCYAAEWLLAGKLGYRGLEMQPMRLLSCIVHSANSLATLSLLRMLRLPQRWSLLGAALFATHPVHVENIVYLVGRADALATLFSLWAVLLYLRLTLRPSPRLPLAAHLLLAVLTATAGLCKEPGFTVLFFLACAELVLRCRMRHFLLLLVSFVALGGLRVWYVGGTEAGFGYVDTPVRYQDEWLTRTLTYLYQHAYYAKLLLLPWNQSWDYSFDALPMLRSLEDSRMLAVLAAYLAISALAAHGLRLSARRPAVVLGLGLTVIPFVPASNLFFLVGTTVGERLLYPCTVGGALLAASLAAAPVRAGKSSSGASGVRLWHCAATALLPLYVYNSNVRMHHWRGPSSLFETDALHWSRSAKVLHSKASELQARGDLEPALETYLRSLEVFDDQAITDYCIARILINLERYDEARERFTKILNGHGIGFHDGNDFLWMTDLGYLLVRMGSPQEGAHYLQEGLKRMPYSCFGWNALAVAQAHMNQLQEAVQSLGTGLQCDPDSASMWNNLAVVYAYGNMAQQALEAWQRARDLNATLPAVEHNSKALFGQSVPPRLDMYIPLPGRR